MALFSLVVGGEFCKMQCRPAQTQGLLQVLTACDLAVPRLVQTPWKLCASALLQRGSALGVQGGDGFVAPHFRGLSRVCSVLGVRGRSPPHQEPLFQRDSTTTAPGWGTAWASATTATSTPSSCPCPSSPPSSSPVSSPTSPLRGQRSRWEPFEITFKQWILSCLLNVSELTSNASRCHPCLP